MPPRQSFLLLAVLACVVLMLPHTSASSCTALVKEYLHEIHASRRPVSKRVDAAREHFNEVRTSGTSGEADARAKLQEAEKALAAFDAAVVDKYGRHLPRTCIDELQEEVQALPPLNSDHVLFLAFQGMHRVLWYHLRLHWNILRGVMDHNLHGWYPMLDRFRLSCNAFFDKAHDCYDLAHPLDASGQRHTLPSTLHVVLYSVQGMAYACVPLILGAVLLVSLAMMAIPAGVVLILPDLIYQIWGRIFFAAFTFGLTTQGAVWAAMMEYVAMLMGGELTEMKDRLLDALEALVAESNIKFYNGIIAAFTLIYPLMMIGVVLLSWILTRCCHRD